MATVLLFVLIASVVIFALWRRYIEEPRKQLVALAVYYVVVFTVIALYAVEIIK